MAGTEQCCGPGAPSCHSADPPQALPQGTVDKGQADRGSPGSAGRGGAVRQPRDVLATGQISVSIGSVAVSTWGCRPPPLISDSRWGVPCPTAARAPLGAGPRARAGPVQDITDPQ